MAANWERVITIVAGTEPKLLAALAVLRAECAARNAVLRQVTEITRYPGGVFVRVRPVERRAPASSYRPRTVPPRRGPRPGMVGIVGVVVLVLAVGVLAVVALGWVVGHWRPMLGVAVVVGLIALAIRGAAR